MHVEVLEDGDHKYALDGARRVTFLSLSALVHHYAKGREGGIIPCRLMRPLVFGPTQGETAL